MSSPNPYSTLTSTPGSPVPSIREILTRPQTGPVGRSDGAGFMIPEWASQAARDGSGSLNNSQSSLGAFSPAQSDRVSHSDRTLSDSRGRTPPKRPSNTGLDRPRVSTRNTAVQAQVGSLEDDLQKLKDGLGQHVDQRIDILVRGVETHVKASIDKMRREQNARFEQEIKLTSEETKRESRLLVDSFSETVRKNLEDTTMAVVATEQRLRASAEHDKLERDALKDSLLETCTQRLRDELEEEKRARFDEFYAIRSQIASLEQKLGSTNELEDERMERKEQCAALRACFEASIASVEHKLAHYVPSDQLNASLSATMVQESTLRAELDEERAERREQCAALRACFEATRDGMSSEQTLRMSEVTEKAERKAEKVQQATSDALRHVEERWLSKVEDERIQRREEVTSLNLSVEKLKVSLDALSDKLEQEVVVFTTGLETMRIDIQSLQSSSRTQAGCQEESSWSISKLDQEAAAFRSKLTEQVSALRSDLDSAQTLFNSAKASSPEDEDRLMMQAQTAVAAATRQLMEVIESERKQRLAQADLLSERLEGELVKQREAVTVEQRRALEGCAPLEVTRDLNDALGSLRKALAEEQERNEQLRAEVNQAVGNNGSLDSSQMFTPTVTASIMEAAGSSERVARVETELANLQKEMERMLSQVNFLNSQAAKDDGPKSEGLQEAIGLESGLTRLRATLSTELNERFTEEVKALRLESTKVLQTRILAVERKMEGIAEIGQMREEAIHLLEPQVLDTAQKVENFEPTVEKHKTQLVDQKASLDMLQHQFTQMVEQHQIIALEVAKFKESSQNTESLLSQLKESVPSKQDGHSSEHTLENSLRSLISKVDKKLRNTEDYSPSNSQSLQAASPGLRPWDNVVPSPPGVDPMGLSWNSVPRQSTASVPNKEASTTATQTDGQSEKGSEIGFNRSPSTSLRELAPLPSAYNPSRKIEPASTPSDCVSISSATADAKSTPALGEVPHDQESFLRAIKTLREENSWLREKNADISERLLNEKSQGKPGAQEGAAAKTSPHLGGMSKTVTKESSPQLGGVVGSRKSLHKVEEESSLSKTWTTGQSSQQMQQYSKFDTRPEHKPNSQSMSAMERLSTTQPIAVSSPKGQSRGELPRRSSEEQLRLGNQLAQRIGSVRQGANNSAPSSASATNLQTSLRQAAQANATAAKATANRIRSPTGQPQSVASSLGAQQGGIPRVASSASAGPSGNTMGYPMRVARR